MGRLCAEQMREKIRRPLRDRLSLRCLLDTSVGMARRPKQCSQQCSQPGRLLPLSYCCDLHGPSLRPPSSRQPAPSAPPLLLSPQAEATQMSAPTQSFLEVSAGGQTRHGPWVELSVCRMKGFRSEARKQVPAWFCLCF